MRDVRAVLYTLHVPGCVSAIAGVQILRCRGVAVQEWVHLHQDSFSRISGSKLLDVVGLRPSRRILCFAQSDQTLSDSIQ